MPKYNFRNKKVKPESSSSSESEDDSDYETVDDSSSESETDSNPSDSESESESEKPTKQKEKASASVGGKKKNEKPTKNNKNKDKKKHAASADDDGEYNTEEEAEDLYELLSEMFPSKYINQKKEASRKLTALNNVRQVRDHDKKSEKGKKAAASTKSASTSKDKDEKGDAAASSSSKKSKKAAKSDKHKSLYDNDAEDDENSSDDSDYDPEADEDDDEDETMDANKINIFFTIDESSHGFDEFYQTTTADADAECDSEDEEVFMKETYEKVPVPAATPPLQNNLYDTHDVKGESSETTATQKHKNKKRKLSTDADDEVVLKDVAQEYLDLVELRKDLTQKLQKSPKNKILRSAVEDCKKSIHKLVKKSRTRNLKQYHKLIKNSGGQKTNEFDYFKTRMSNKEQLKIMEDLKKINKHINVDKPYRLALLQSNIPTHFKALAMQKMNLLRSMEPGDSEYYKIKNWVDNFMRIPFGTYRNLPVQLSDGMVLCQNFMENAKRTLDDCVYGMDDAKMQIMQLIGQWIVNPASIGTAIAIKGAAGIGKTTLVRDGISKILGRDFSFIPLGGCSDGSYLTGNGYVYEGASHGKIVQVLIDSRSMNPVIFFDELDKVSDTPKGEEITGVLTHLTDTTQNSQFHDKYFSEIDFDMSKCLYIFSYNDETKINPILKDRMYRIEIKGYDTKDKVVIAKNYLLPKIREMVAFSETDVVIPDETIEYIASNKQFSQDEKGVRNLKRCLEIIFTKLNLYRLMKKEPDAATDTATTTTPASAAPTATTEQNTNTIIKNSKLQVEFPFTVTKFAVDQLVKINDAPNVSLLSMYI
jgi:ATP-dependent Lon protease